MLRFILRLVRKYQNARRRQLTSARSRQDRSRNTYSVPTGSKTTPKMVAASGAVIRDQISALPKFRARHIIDGDTVIVSSGLTELKIRLDSIDCPEDGQEWGDIAKYGLVKLIGSQDVHLELHGLDVHGRTLATIYVWHAAKSQWLNVNERMVTLGHAWVMRRFYDHLPSDRQHQLNRLECWARSKKVGLWRAANPTPPWHYRQGR